MGIDANLTLVGEQLDVSCMKNNRNEKLHIVFMGDSTMRQVYVRFLEGHNMEVSEDTRNKRIKFAESHETGILNATNKQILLKSITDDINASYIEWLGAPTIVQRLIDMVSSASSKNKFVFWMGTAIHNLCATSEGCPVDYSNWIVPEEWATDRQVVLTKLLREMKGGFQLPQLYGILRVFWICP